MLQAHTILPVPTARARTRDDIVTWLRALQECRSGGLVTDEDYGYQRAEKLDQLLHPPRCLWLAPTFGALVAAGIGGGAMWWLTGHWLYTGFAATLSGLWGIYSIGRLLREKFIEVQLRGRRKVLLALLENDLLDAHEFADFDDRLQQAHPDKP